jgi:hypothetical protein
VNRDEYDVYDADEKVPPKPELGSIRYMRFFEGETK